MKLWDVPNLRRPKTLKGHENAVYSVVFSPDGKTLATGSWDKTVKLWDVDTGEELCILKAHSSAVQSLAFSPGGKILASGDWDHKVKLWRAASEGEVQAAGW